MTIRKSHHRLERPPFECIALVLQGGGALGAFQAGVYQALAEADLLPDWVAGISIGAINAALIAGNPPETRIDRLRAFWEQISTPVLPEMAEVARNLLHRRPRPRLLQPVSRGRCDAQGRARFLLARARWRRIFYPAGTLEATSYYDTALLRGTLERLIDFDRINAGPTRASASAPSTCVAATSSISIPTRHTITPEHVMASGALPPGFPAVEIEGELYWDGGLVSNTPLQWVVSGDTRLDTLAFQVDLWSARGEAPRDMPEVISRQKEIQYSSRTRANTDQFQENPDRARRRSPMCSRSCRRRCSTTEDVAILKAVADRKVYKIVHLIYRSRHYERQSKDYEFSRLSMQEHWEAGYNDAVRTLRHPEALMRPTDRSGVATFDIGVDGRD